jgi:acetolactate synthase-1/2/3 large subunit
MTETVDLNQDELSCAAWVARFLAARGVDRVFGLQGGHIQPIWDHLGRLGIRIVDVRHECAAVHMAQAHAELTGSLGVAMVTAGPGVTNTVTGMANASLARMPVLLIGGCTSRPQANMGPLQDIPHTDILRPVCRYARTARVAEQVVRELDEAVARAMGDLGEPGPSYIEIPTDVLRTHVPENLVLADWLRPKPPRILPPDPTGVAAAVEALWSSRRPLVVTGRGARDCGTELVRLLDATGAVYLDTQESRGLVPPDHPGFIGAMRAAAMAEADTVLVVGRKLDYQLGYGSPAVFPDARFVRLADNAGELVDNRRGDPELLATPALALAAIVTAAGNRESVTDRAWAEGLRRRHVERSRAGSVPERGEDGKVHPAAIFAAIKKVADPDYIAIADGGDLLSFARVGLEARTYLDAGAFGCLGVGVPYAVAAALACPDRQVICVTGDGAFGINAMEIDSMVRHGAKAVVIVSNNAAWNIERFDQEFNYGGRVIGTVLAHSDYAAMVRGLGAHGERVENPADLPAALERALANAPALIDVVTPQSAVSSDARKGLGFVPDYQPLTAWDDAERKRRGLA